MDDLNTDNVALHDLDGTLADYDKGMRDDYLKLCSPQELMEMGPYFNPSDIRHGHVAARTRMIRSFPGWWRNLKRYLSPSSALPLSGKLVALTPASER
jgi:hypothetical protein